MIVFRTILLWLSFALLLLGEISDYYPSIEFGLFMRLLPNGLLILWFLLSIFFREKLKFRVAETPAWVLKAIVYLRPLSSITIILGALFKLLDFYSGNWFLVAGIGFMAFYSSLISRFANRKNEHQDIIDNFEN